ncbi:MAG: acetyltransferase [Hydrogenophilales bacterium 28-61-23]|nr:MAG: acetyltransferase [Hydrogenophilales bacterium 28-61-23]
MQAENFQLSAYFQRIGYLGEARPDLACVAEIMRCQLHNVPFENLDVQAGKGISLAPEAIVDKIVGRRRGGYCYEVNGLLAMALAALGVPYRFVGCRPMTYPARRPRTHMALLARLDGEEWLCDVGFGSYGMRAPMRLNETDEVRQDFDTFQLTRPNEREYQLRAKVDGDWADQYCFDLAYHEWIDFLPANWLNSTHPDTIFTKHLIVMRQTPDGRVILFGGRLKTVARGEVKLRQVPPDEIDRVLRETFGLDLASA